ncbi:MAG: cyclic nucleotide-binding domain-containing protein [Chromatiaceae bacterium]|nr:cyclic nucleotide-binding domain-containing protein [Gammaproteobacteria bacterium]MCP5303939.1 cyclic nucleotide-binding domain-containing protein [Chromatiaceae bacterium]MCP5313666.1 cyclic nucleotide-binding domain-containing protein [Chromatiaceae bacterium]
MAAERGMELAFIECLPHLIPLYQKLGFRRVGPGFYRDDSGVLSPMCLVVRDLAYLKERRSPLYATARQLFGEALPPSWLEALFPDGEPGDDTAAAIERWSEAHGVLSTGELHAQTVLGGFSADELQRVIERGVVIDCSAGERLILSGSGHRNLYIVLEGSCEVRLDGRSLGVVAAGDVVGEMAWLLDSQRTADVVATSDRVRVLSLTDADLDRMVASGSREAIKFLLNLSRVLGRRLLALRALLGPVGV